MRTTTIRLEDALLKEAKIYAAQTDRTLTDLMREGLVTLMQRERFDRPRKKIKLNTFGGSGTFPGIDINRTSELLDRMDFGDLRDDA